MAQAQPKDWREKYLDLVEHQESQQQEFENQQEQLRRALVRVSLAAEGSDPELDKVLAALREHLKSPDIHQHLHKRLTVVEEAVIASEERRGLRLLRLQEAISALLEQLKALSPDRATTKHIKSLGSDLKNRLSNQQDIVMLVQELAAVQGKVFNSDESGKTGLLQKWLSNKDKALPTDDTSITLDADPINEQNESENKKLTSQVLAELNAIIDLVENGIEDKQALAGLRQQLQSQFGLDRLENFLRQLKTLLDDTVARTKRDFGEFLQKTNSQLRDISEILNYAGKLAHQQNDHQQQFYFAMGNDLQSLQTTVAQASDLEVLKQEVSSQLETIRAKLGKAEASPNSLSEQLKDLLKKVEQFEKDAQTTSAILDQQRQKAETDSLTGLPNREAYQQRLSLELARWQRYNNPLSLAVLDIDHFKRINDNYGHQAGDRVLKLIAKVIRQNLRETDFIGRYGGEEFVVILPETDIQKAEVVLNKIRKKIAGTQFHFRKQPVQITVSIGFSEFNGADTDAVVFGRADKALYQAKNQGRNCCKQA